MDELALPATSLRPASLVVTDLAMIEPTQESLVLRERAPGVSIKAIRAVTAATLLTGGELAEMRV